LGLHVISAWPINPSLMKLDMYEPYVSIKLLGDRSGVSGAISKTLPMKDSPGGLGIDSISSPEDADSATVYAMCLSV